MCRATPYCLALCVLLSFVSACDDVPPDPSEEDLGLLVAALELDLEGGRGPVFDPLEDPVPFVPFTLSDLQSPSGGPVAPDTLLPLGDGTSRRADEAIALLNDAERQVAEAGSSLREASPVASMSPSKPPVRYVARTDVSTLEAQRQAYEEAFQPLALDEIVLAGELSHDDYREVFDGEEQQEVPGIGKPLRPPADPTDCVDEPFEVQDDYDFTLGADGVLEASLGAHVKLSGDEDKAVFVGDSYAGGSLFGAEFAVFDVHGRFVGPEEGPGRGRVRVTLLGTDIYEGPTEGGDTHDGMYVETLRAGTKIPIANLLGIVRVDARVGVEGQAGMRYYARTGKRMARGSVTGWAGTSGFAKVIAGPKIDLGIVKAKLQVGADVELTFLEDNMRVDGLVQAIPGECVNYHWNYKGTNELAALAGTLDLFARARGCVLGLCVGHSWVWHLFDWDGISAGAAIVFDGRS